jgi:hypothetical protein
MATRVTLSLRHESPTAYTLDFQSQTLLRFEDSGKRARLTAAEPCPFPVKDILRWGAPFALAPQGIVCLHASAVRKNDMTVAFLGIGGSGKSTLARGLADQKWDRLADDMMLVDDIGRVNTHCEKVLHRWCDCQTSRILENSDDRSLTTSATVNYEELADQLRKPDQQKWVWLSALIFLDETRGKEFRLRPLESGKCFHRLVKYGFGGLPTPAAWEHQFRVYGALAAKLKASLLQTPEGMEQLTANLSQLENTLTQWLSDSGSTQS